MEDNKRDYSDFFNRPNNEESAEELKNKAEQQREQEMKQERPAYYYSYGPHKSEESAHADAQSKESVNVEVSPPRPLKPFGISSEYKQPPMGSWEYGKKKKGNSFKGMFAAFMAGVVVVGGLMFASDKMNLFSGDSGILNSGGSSPVSAISTPSGGGGVKNASMNVVRPNNIADIAKNASPAVVKIDTFVDPKSSGNGSGGSMFDDPMFNQFFGDFFGQQQPRGNQRSQNNGQPQPLGMGSGFIFEKSGYILTNEHVVDGADPNNIEVTVQGYEKPFKAKLLGTSYDLDLAVIKISNDKDFPTLKIGDSDQLDVGDWLVAIGNPYGFDHTVTVGVLSAKDRPINIPDQKGTRQYKHLLQTDASINPGNSGGPLLNLNGEVIGINTAVSAQAQGIGFAIPTGTINSVLENLKNNVKIPKPYVGVYMADIPKDWVDQLKLDSTDGVIVRTVVQGSPAEKAGLQPYDVVLDIDGKKVKDANDFQTKVLALKVGQQVNMTIVRKGQKMTTGITIGNSNE